MESEEIQRQFRFDRLFWAMLLVLATAIIVSFAGSFHAQFVENDDGIYVSRNPHVMGGLTAENIRWDFTNKAATLWIPVTWLSFQLDSTLAGEQPSKPDATPYHIDNVILHLLAAITLFLFLTRATKSRWASFVVALLWSIHPLRVESVAWVTERKDVLSGVLGFAAGLLYVQWCERKSRAAYAGMIVAFILSLMAKTAFITFPFAMLLFDYWPLKRMTSWEAFRKRLVEKIPLFIVTGIFSWIQYEAAAGANYSGTFTTRPFSVRAINTLHAYVKYLQQHFDFGHLAFSYPYHADVPWWNYALCGCLLLLLTVGCFWQARRRPWLIVGWLWFLGTLVPMIGLVQTGAQPHADRFTYIPSVGLFVMVVWSIPWRRLRTPAIAALGAAVVVLCGFTIRQVGTWYDSETLATHAIAVTSDNYAAWGLLGLALSRSGHLDQAIEAYQKALRMKPTDPQIQLALAAAYFDSRRWEDAFKEFAVAVDTEPNNPVVHNLYGIALGQTGHFEAAAHQFDIAAHLRPEDQQLKRNYARAMELARQQAAASAPATRALEK